jgi:hypothetical protein
MSADPEGAAAEVDGKVTYCGGRKPPRTDVGMVGGGTDCGTGGLVIACY